jgi:hypothetical protein
VVAELGGNAFPFVEENLSKNRRIRMFPETVWEEDLVWHRDAEDRTIKVISSNGWKLQMDNELPKDLIIGESHFIPKKEYHRVIKGEGELIVEIVSD